ncbi:MAG: hypothetical protein E5299_00719 [Burkholderia gladioli]|nr:MAG: hypothetical protein E5299_00719 [Burkholderia gladioli]
MGDHWPDFGVVMHCDFVAAPAIAHPDVITRATGRSGHAADMVPHARWGGSILPPSSAPRVATTKPCWPLRSEHHACFPAST